MQQASLLDNAVIEADNSATNQSRWAVYFASPSLLNNGIFHSTIGKGAKAVTRTICAKENVSVYRNLNKPAYFSLKKNTGDDKGRVGGYAKAVVIQSPSFVISLASHQRVLKEKRKNVHAYIRGQCVDAFDSSLLTIPEGAMRVSYSPYVGPYLYCLERDDTGSIIPNSISCFDDVGSYAFALITGSDIFLLNN